MSCSCRCDCIDIINVYIRCDIRIVLLRIRCYIFKVIYWLYNRLWYTSSNMIRDCCIDVVGYDSCKISEE